VGRSLEWEEAGVLGDTEPLFAIRKFSATKLRELREQTFELYPQLEQVWREEFSGSEGMQNYLNALGNYPELKGMKANLYKCFLPQAWKNSTQKGVSAFLHPEGVYDDPKGGLLRESIYKRLRFHAQFHNELQLFSEVHHATIYGVSVYGDENEVRFRTIANLFSPSTIELCFTQSMLSVVPGIKELDERTQKFTWSKTGHPSRLLLITSTELALFAKLYDEPGTPPEQARLPALHAKQLISVLDKFAKQPKQLGDLGDQIYSTQH